MTPANVNWDQIIIANLQSFDFYLALLGGLLPAGLWLWFWLKEDNARPEPKRLILATFLVGGLGIFPAFMLERWVKDFFFADNGGWAVGPLTISFGLVLVWVLIEESIKFGAVWLTSAHNRAYDEPGDAMVYLITAALGFAALENTLYILGDLRNTFELDFVSLAITGNLRFIGATILHVTASGLFGFGLALGFYARGWARWLWGLFGLLLATALHAAFNLSIINLSQAGAAEHQTGLWQIFQIFLLLWLVTILVILLFEKAKTIKNPWPKDDAHFLKS